MKAITFHDSKIKIEYIKEPEIINFDDVKVKVLSVGLCGSDIHKIIRNEIPKDYLKTSVLGHEVSGEVIKVGKNVKNFDVGDFVCVEPICPRKFTENYQFENDTLFLGRDIQGGFSEKIVVPSSALCKITDIDMDVAALADVVAVALHGINKCITEKGDIAVIGDGAIALSTIALCKILKLERNLVCFGCSQYKLEIAKKLGATNVYSGKSIPPDYLNNFNVVFEAVGGSQNETLKNAISMTKPTGTIGIFGVFSPDFLHTVYLRPAFYKELNILGINSYSIYKGEREFFKAVDIIKTNQNIFKSLISHKEPLDNFEKIISRIKYGNNEKILKVIFNP